MIIILYRYNRFTTLCTVSYNIINIIYIRRINFAGQKSLLYYYYNIHYIIIYRCIIMYYISRRSPRRERYSDHVRQYRYIILLYGIVL